MRRLAAFFAAIIVFAAVFLLIEQTSQSFQYCIGQEGGDTSSHAGKESYGGISSVIIAYTRCSGRFIDAHGAGITAFFTIILAVSTILLWQVTNKAAEAAKAAAEHIPRVERAYMFWGPGKISIGANPKDGEFTIVEMNVTHLGQTPDFSRGSDINFLWTNQLEIRPIPDAICGRERKLF